MMRFTQLGIDVLNPDALYVAAVSGDVESVNAILNEGKFDLNRLYNYRDIQSGALLSERLLLRVLSLVKTKYDQFYQISELLIRHLTMDVKLNAWINAGIGTTYLSELCNRNFGSTLALDLLLSSDGIHVNKGVIICPLFIALRNIEEEGDYFYIHMKDDDGKIMLLLVDDMYTCTY